MTFLLLGALALLVLTSSNRARGIEPPDPSLFGPSPYGGASKAMNHDTAVYVLSKLIGFRMVETPWGEGSCTFAQGQIPEAYENAYAMLLDHWALGRDIWIEDKAADPQAMAFKAQSLPPPAVPKGPGWSLVAAASAPWPVGTVEGTYPAPTPLRAA